MKIALSILLAIVLVLGGGALIAGPQLQKALSKLKPEPKSLTVRVELVKHGTLTESVSAPGEIEPHTKVVVYSEVSARIEGLPFEEGDRVTKGDIIVRLDNRDLKAALASRVAQREESKYRIESERSLIAGSRNDLAFANRTLTRQQALFDSGDISLSQLDQARQSVDDLKSRIDASMHTISVMESSLAAAQANIARAERNLENTVIKAPMDGVITVLNVEVGEAVLGMVSNMGTTIMVIADLARMVMQAKVPESDIAKILQGQNARIHLNAYPDEIFSGTITKIALQRTSDPDGTGYFLTEIEIDLRGRLLRSGLNANVDIEIAFLEGLEVESQAIVHRLIEDLPDELKRDQPLIDHTKRTVRAVYLMVDGKAVFTPVKSGSSDLTHTIVLEGLTANDLVIVGPYKVLEDLTHDEDVNDPNFESDDETADSALADSKVDGPETQNISHEDSTDPISSGASQ